MPTLSMHRLLRRLFAARDGGVAVLFAAVLVPVIGIASAAIDYGRAAKVRATLQTAVSAAAQAASAHLFEDKSLIEREAHVLLKSNLPGELAELPHRVTIPEDRSSVEVAMQTTVPTTLLGVMGVPAITVEATGFARPVLGAAAGHPTGGGVVDDPTGPRGGLLRGVAPAVVKGLAANPSPAELQEALREIGDRIREIAPQAATRQIDLPPAAAADVERWLRELQRSR